MLLQTIPTCFRWSSSLSRMPRSCHGASGSMLKARSGVTSRPFVSSRKTRTSHFTQATNLILIAPRLVASRVMKWLRTVVLPTQDVLVDAPHLVQRNPALLTGDPNNTVNWEKTTVVGDLSTDAGVSEQAASYRYADDRWLGRPTWRIDQLQRDPQAPDPWSVEHVDLVFCEDISSFLPREAARQFVVDVSTSTPTRYISGNSDEVRNHFADPPVADVEYIPASRLAESERSWRRCSPTRWWS